jgi:molybdopterin adenylyltransferase
VETDDRQSPALSKAHVITVSDGVFHGTREDKSGRAVRALLKDGGFEVGEPEVVADEVERITEAIETAITRGAEVIVTTGGTGLGPRDVTPQATASLVNYEVPGIAEEMRRAGAASTPMAALSRGIAGVRGTTLIVNVPGSVKGATESLQAVMPVLGHAVQLLRGNTAH